ncbi:MAG: hydrogenase formation protein HypD [Candidatus Hydrogenedentes bacterium]|nr:hydrogenase formation protein HypD [Candidatus Hydrogenedentota bacterium]
MPGSPSRNSNPKTPKRRSSSSPRWGRPPVTCPPFEESVAARTRHMRERLARAAGAVGRHVRVMEVCGTHTHAIGRGGLRAMLPGNVELVSGPGCPVCVTSQRDIERMLVLARHPGLTVCTFGDMIRVPGITSSLERERSAGADIRVVYSPVEALALAEREPEREVAFLAVGFETTSPGVASVLLQAHGRAVANLSVYASHKLIVPAMHAVLDGGSRIDGFVTPGHVSVVIGPEAYEALSTQYSIPCVATGFEPIDVLEGIGMLLECMAEGRTGSFVQYTRAVKPGGNRRAWDTLLRAFEVADAEWRGLGAIPSSGLRLKPELRHFDAVARYAVPDIEPVDLPGCRCGDVLKGLIHPPECPLFRTACTPRNPIGPCMVSSEGSCAARYRYG